MERALTARDVQEALEERISKGQYGRGDRLPPVRSIAAEFGTSPSTVSRALREMMRSGWLEVHERQFVRVRQKLAPNTVRRADFQRTIKSIAHKWKMWGGRQDELIDTIGEVVAEVFESRPNFVFAECNAHDLEFMGRRLAEIMSGMPVTRSLIADLDRRTLQRTNAVVLVPFYHYAEVKSIVGLRVPIVPVHTAPSIETLDELLTIPSGARVLIVGHNGRSIARLSGLVRDYVEDADITGVALNERAKIKKLAPAADVLVAVKIAAAALPKLPGQKRLIEVHFALDASLGERLGSLVPRAPGAGGRARETVRLVASRS